MKSNILFIFLLLGSILFSKPLEGVWEAPKLGKVTVRQFGEKNQGYFVQIKGDQYFFKETDKVFTHQIKVAENKYSTWEMHRKKRTLFLQLSHETYNLKRVKKRLPEPDKEPQLNKDGFFDLSTSSYCAGEFYDLSSKAFLPFQISREFVSNNNLKDVHFEWREGTKQSEETKMRYDFNYSFDTYGNVKTMKSKTFADGEPTKNEIEWFYYYGDASAGTLDSIIIHTKIPTGQSGTLKVHQSVLYFDKDNWGVDEKGQKYPRAFQYEWTYDNHLPKSWKGTKGKREDYSMSFEYKEEQLVKMIFTNEKHDHSKVNEFVFNYNERGILTQVIRVSDK